MTLTCRTRLAGLVCAALASVLLGCGSKEATRPSQPPATPKPAAQSQAAPIAESGAAVIDITAADAYAPTWVVRVDKCDVSASDGSLVCKVVGGSDISGGQYGGVKVKVGSVKAVGVDVTFTNPENIAAAFMDLTVGEGTKPRVRWQFILSGGQHMPSGKQSFTFRPDQSTGGFQYGGGEASIERVDHAQFFIKLRPKSTAGFQMHRMVVER